MKTGERLDRAFFARPCLAVAEDLVGAFLSHRIANGDRLVGRIVEVEAYLGDGSDPAAHSHVGPTERNRSMFGPPGRLYAYRSYGVHVCVNVVCQPAGEAAAVLLRALEPLAGLARMRRLRGLPEGASPRTLARGPGRLAAAMGFELEHDGASLVRGPIALHAPPRGARPAPIVRGPRVGITRAAALPYRFAIADSPWVSPFRPGKQRTRTASGRSDRSSPSLSADPGPGSRAPPADPFRCCGCRAERPRVRSA